VLQGLPTGYDKVSVLQGFLKGTDKVVCWENSLNEISGKCAVGSA
jgi:hypothetical protein